MTDQGFGQGRPQDTGHAAYEAPGQPQLGAGYGPGAGYPGQVTAGYPAPSQVGASSKGFVGSLFDFGFTSFVTPTIVKVLYVLIMIVLGLAALGSAIFAFLFNPIFGIFTLLIVAPLYFFIFLALYRVGLELFIIVFRIAEDVRAIRERDSLP